MSYTTAKAALRRAQKPLLLFLALFVGASSPAFGQSQNEDTKLVPADNDEDDLLGSAVSIDGDLALIGAYSDDSLNMDCGAAYVYRFDGGCWVEEAELLASDGNQGDHLGSSVAISGELALVAAYNDCDCWAGAIYVYRFDAQSQTWNQEAKLVGPNPAGGDGFGASVAAFGDVVLVGAPGDDPGGTDVGAAYVFRYDSQSATWSSGLKLEASDGVSDAFFGTSVSLDGNVALIGARGDDDHGYWSGSAYVFRYDEQSQAWSQEDKLTAADAAGSDEFGSAVSVSGDLAVIGAPWDDDVGNQSGSAYVFQYHSGSQSWIQRKKLVASDGVAYAHFGDAVSISADRVLIGASEDDENGYKAGAAYVYRDETGSNTWPQETKLIASDGDSMDKFGDAVSISAGRALMGAPSDEHSGSFSGSAYLANLGGGSAGTLNEDAKILASDGDNGDKFGHAVSISNGLAIFGAEQDEPAGTWSGSAYVGRYDSGTGTWIEEAKLVASDADSDDFFGESVSISGDVAVVGAYQDEDNSQSGSAYVFRRNGASQTWSEEAKLMPSDGALWDSFGFASAVSGDAALVGAYQNDDAGSNSGSAYVFRYDSQPQTWGEEQKLVAADAQQGDRFGYAVSLSGDVALVGAYGGDGGDGSAYVFRYDTGAQQWNQQAELVASDGAPGDQFGSSVAIDGDIAVVGAPGDDDAGTSSGSAYVFRFDPQSQTWSEEIKLTAFDGAQDDYFGHSVAVSDERVVVGSYVDDDGGSGSGSAYLFHWACCCWTLEAKLLAADAAANDGFGHSVSVSGGLVLIGSVYDDSWTGAGYLFDRGGDSCAATRYCAPSALGTQIDIDTCSLGAGSINLTYSNGTPGRVGYLLVGQGTGIITNPPGAVGDLCLGGASIGRYINDMAVIDGSGRIVTDIIAGNTGGGAGNLPGTIGGTIGAGETWNFQYWARHQNVSSTFSDALAVTFTN
ncbi:MAG: hypothetical protein GY711_33125 [bacterium]|nr:hypothetical protein [bacterium]